jgi:chemotaxis protein CheC
MDEPINTELLTAYELDALREVASIGAAHAATALSQLIDNRVMITVPEVNILPVTQIPRLAARQEELMAGLYMRVVGQGQGAILISFPRSSALHVVNLMFGHLQCNRDILAELEDSALREAGNILAGAFVNSISNFLHLTLLVSVPRLAFDMGGALLESLLVESEVERDYAFVMSITFQTGEATNVSGRLLLLADDDTMKLLIARLREISQR